MKAKKIYPLVLSLLVATTAWAQSENEETALLTGTLYSQKFTGGAAILRSGANGLGFYATANVTVAANTAFVNRTKTILINLQSLDSNTDGIAQPERPLQPERTAVYDLSGRRQTSEHRGVNIVRKDSGNGAAETKKVVR